MGAVGRPPHHPELKPWVSPWAPATTHPAPGSPPTVSRALLSSCSCPPPSRPPAAGLGTQWAVNGPSELLLPVNLQPDSEALHLGVSNPSQACKEQEWPTWGVGVLAGQ